MSLSEPSTRPSAMQTSLASNRLGVPAVVIFTMSAATPLTVVAGVVTTGFAVTGILGIPLAFVLIGLVLALFSVGYVAMARYIANAGAFYAYVAQGLGKPAGVGAAWVALLAYNALQVGLYGAIGAAAGPLLDQWFGVDMPWWVVALCAWALVAVMGVLRVDINGRVLALLLITEVAVIMVFNIAELAHPAGGQLSFDSLSPGNLFTPGVGALLALAVLGFVGFEGAAVFSEESKDPRRTVPMATYTSVALIAVLYALSSWAMTVATGPDQVVAQSQQQQTELIFNLAGAHLGGTVVDIGHALFLTSILAAMISFHNTTARYMFALGRERVLPAAFGRTARTGAPHVGSITQSVIGLVVILTYAVAGWDPLVQLFFWLGTGGGFGVLLLITTTSIAALVFFARREHGESIWASVVAPSLASLALLVVVTLAFVNFADLLGVAPDSVLRWAIPGSFVVVAVGGVIRALLLRSANPQVYATIGLGARAATGLSQPATALTAGDTGRRA